MSSAIDLLIEKIRDLEMELEVELAQQAETLRIRVFNGKIEYTEEILAAHRALKSGLLKHVLGSNPLKLLTLPFIYGLALPLVFLDASVSLYQAVCFPVYGIPKVHRQDYLVFDRAQLEYLNAIEKAHCAYCSYANGLIGYAREIAARTEQYWCPIKHAKRIKTAHSRYSRFIDYGDGEAYRNRLQTLRKKFDDAGTP
jgi:hypothetical protein